MLALAGSDEAMPGIRIELGVMIAASDEITFVVQKLARPRIQTRALMRAGIFKTEELVGLARDQDRSQLGLATLLHPHQHKTPCLTVVNLKSSTYRKKLIHRRIPFGQS